MISDILEAAEQLVEAITFDNSGVFGKGGNGGLISIATIRKADELRIAISKHRKLNAG